MITASNFEILILFLSPGNQQPSLVQQMLYDVSFVQQQQEPVPKGSAQLYCVDSASATGGIKLVPSL